MNWIEFWMLKPLLEDIPDKPERTHRASHDWGRVEVGVVRNAVPNIDMSDFKRELVHATKVVANELNDKQSRVTVRWEMMNCNNVSRVLYILSQFPIVLVFHQDIMFSWSCSALAKLSVMTIFRYKYKKCEAPRLDRAAAAVRPRQLITDDDTLPSVNRCKFWPDCPNLKACIQHHPFEPCEKFPNCEAVLRLVLCFPKRDFNKIIEKFSCSCLWLNFKKSLILVWWWKYHELCEYWKSKNWLVTVATRYTPCASSTLHVE